MTLTELEMKILAMREVSRARMLMVDRAAATDREAKEVFDFHEGRVVLADEILALIRPEHTDERVFQ